MCHVTQAFVNDGDRRTRFSARVLLRQRVTKCPGRAKTIHQMNGLENHPVSIQYQALATEIEGTVTNRDDFITSARATTQPEE